MGQAGRISLSQWDLDGDIGIRVVGRDIPRPVLGSEPVDHVVDPVGVSDGRDPGRVLGFVDREADRGALHQVLVPISVGSSDREQVERGVILDKPDRDGDLPASPRAPTDPEPRTRLGVVVAAYARRLRGGPLGPEFGCLAGEGNRSQLEAPTEETRCFT